MNYFYKKYFSIQEKFIRIIGFLILLSFLFSSNLQPQDYPGKIKIGVVFSENNWQQRHPGDYNYFFIQDWEIFFMNHRLNYKVFTDDDLDDFNFDDVDVLILPGIEILTDEAIQNILDFLNEGKSVFLLGNNGNLTPLMRIRLNNILKELAGCTVKEVNQNKQNARSIIINSSQFPGQTVNNKEIFLLNNLPIYYTDKTNNNLAGGFLNDNSNDEELNTAILFGKYGKGRFAWFGFQISQFAEGTISNSPGESLILNTINYLSGFPLIILNDFPADYRNAVLIVNKIHNKPELKKIIRRIGSLKNFKTDFFISPFLINDKEFNLTELAEYGSVHLLYDPPDFFDKSAEWINKLLNNCKNKIQQLTNQKSIGIWEEDSYYDDAGAELLNFNEFDFTIKQYKIISAKNNSIGNDTIFFNLITELSDPVGNLSEREIVRTSEKSRLLFLLLNEFLMQEENFTFDDLNSLLIKLSYKKSWLPSVNEMLEWMEMKQNISCSIHDSRENESLEINISNNNFSAMKNLSFKLMLNENYTDATVNEQMTKFYFDYTTNLFYLKIDSLKAQENKNILIAK